MRLALEEAAVAKAIVDGVTRAAARNHGEDTEGYSTSIESVSEEAGTEGEGGGYRWREKEGMKEEE